MGLAFSWIVLAAGVSGGMAGVPAWRQDPPADERFDPRVYPVTGRVEAADSLPALEVVRETGDEGHRLALQILEVRVSPERRVRVLYAGPRVFSAGEEICHLGYRLEGGRTTLGELLLRMGKAWEGPAAEGLLFVADLVVLDEVTDLGTLLCCPPNAADPYGPRMLGISAEGRELRCARREDQGVARLECDDGEGNGGAARCWACEKAWGAGRCRAFLESGFVPLAPREPAVPRELESEDQDPSSPEP